MRNTQGGVSHVQHLSLPLVLLSLSQMPKDDTHRRPSLPLLTYVRFLALFTITWLWGKIVLKRQLMELWFWARKTVFGLFLITPGRRQLLQSAVQIWLSFPPVRGAWDDSQPPTGFSASTLGFAHRGQKCCCWAFLGDKCLETPLGLCVCMGMCVCMCVCVQCLPLLSFSRPPSQSFFSSLPKLSRSRSNGATEMHQEQAALLKSDRREEQGRMTHVGEALSC